MDDPCSGPEPNEFDLGCFFHGYEGDITQDHAPYLACGECGHLYWTEYQLVDEFNKTMHEGYEKYPEVWLTAPVKAVSGDEIFFCAWCAHDF